MKFALLSFWFRHASNYGGDWQRKEKAKNERKEGRNVSIECLRFVVQNAEDARFFFSRLDTSMIHRLALSYWKINNIAQREMRTSWSNIVSCELD